MTLQFDRQSIALRIVARVRARAREYQMEESEMSQTTNADDLAAQQKRVAAIVQDEMNRTQHGRSNDVRVDALEAKVDELVHTIAQLEQQVQQLLNDVKSTS